MKTYFCISGPLKNGGRRNVIDRVILRVFLRNRTILIPISLAELAWVIIIIRRFCCIDLRAPSDCHQTSYRRRRRLIATPPEVIPQKHKLYQQHSIEFIVDENTQKMEKWVGKVAVVTGASSGIGEETCRQLVARDMIVVGFGRNVDKLQVI